MRIGLITGNHPRHYGFCNEVAKYQYPVGHLLVEREEFIPVAPDYLDSTTKALWDTHFNRRADCEKQWFKNDQALNFVTDTYPCTPDTFNSDEVCDWVQGMDFDFVFILGTPIIKDPLFSILPSWKVNLHMGLIPQYRGSITFWWPFYFLRPQEAGCTYHVIDRLVDTGEIIHQCLPELTDGLGYHDTACKALKTAYADVERVLRHAQLCVEVGIYPMPDPDLAKRGKTFTKADWHPHMLALNYHTYSDNMVSAYLNGHLPTGRKIKLVQLNECALQEKVYLDFTQYPPTITK